MPTVWVYYEEDPVESHLVPQKLNIYFGAGVIKWDESYFYQLLEAPFQRMTPADWYDEDVMSVTISQGELLRNPDKPGHFGIHLPSLKQRLEQELVRDLKNLGLQADHVNIGYEVIQQFIINLADLEEIMQMDVRPYYDWR